MVLQIAKNISDQKYIYYGISIITTLAGVLCLFGIKDVKTTSEEKDG